MRDEVRGVFAEQAGMLSEHRWSWPRLPTWGVSVKLTRLRRLQVLLQIRQGGPCYLEAQGFEGYALKHGLTDQGEQLCHRLLGSMAPLLVPQPPRTRRCRPQWRDLAVAAGER